MAYLRSNAFGRSNLAPAPALAATGNMGIGFGEQGAGNGRHRYRVQLRRPSGPLWGVGAQKGLRERGGGEEGALSYRPVALLPICKYGISSLHASTDWFTT